MKSSSMPVARMATATDPGVVPAASSGRAAPTTSAELTPSTARAWLSYQGPVSPTAARLGAAAIRSR